MLNSTTWLYGAEVLPIALRNKIMGLAAASHFIVNVAGTHSLLLLLPFTIPQIYTDTDDGLSYHSHRSRPQCIRQHTRKLLLCLCSMYAFLLRHRMVLFPVSLSD